MHSKLRIKGRQTFIRLGWDAQRQLGCRAGEGAIDVPQL